MEKKIVSVERIPDGEQHAIITEQVLEARVNEKLAILYKQDYGFLVSVRGEFIVTAKDDEILSMTLSFHITDSPQEVEKYSLATTCYLFFCLNFITHEDGKVSFHADNTFDMALLMQSLSFVNIDVDCWYMPIDINKTVADARNKVRQEELDTLQQTEEEEESELFEETPCNVDEHHVAYSLDGKTLLYTKADYYEPEYRVPDGVEVISDFAFAFCPIPIHLSIPPTVRYIGSNIFGYNGGEIEIRQE